MLIKSQMVKQRTLIFYILMIIFLVKGIFYAVYITPPVLYTSPDDVGHISYIQYIASENNLPILHETSIEKVAHDLFLSYKPNNPIDVNKFVIKEEKFDKKYDDNWIAQHPPLYYLLMTPIYKLAKLFTDKLFIIIIILRIATIPLGLASIFVMNKIMDILKTKNIVRYCVLSCFVFSAPIQFYFSNITNDSLLIFLCILSLYFLLKYISGKRAVHYYLFVVCCALTLITKYTGALVLISYIAYFIYKSLKEDGVIKTSKLCVQGLLLGGIIVAPVFLRNYILYGNPIETSVDMTSIYNITFYKFLKDKGYLNELYNNLIMLIGWNGWLSPTDLGKSVAAIIIFILTSFCLLKDRNKKRQFIYLNVGIIFAFGLYYLLDLQFSLSVALTSLMVLSFYMLSLKDLNIHKKEMNRFFFISILVVFLIFMVQHYRICLHRGRPGATHGRYYYIVIFQFLYFVFNILEEYKFKYTKYIPVILTSILMVCEAQTIMRCIALW